MNQSSLAHTRKGGNIINDEITSDDKLAILNVRGIT
jgi:hypothetical protein